MLGPEKATGKQEGVSESARTWPLCVADFTLLVLKKFPALEVQGNQDRSYVLKRRRVVNG